MDGRVRLRFQLIIFSLVVNLYFLGDDIRVIIVIILVSKFEVKEKSMFFWDLLVKHELRMYNTCADKNLFKLANRASCI